jgi:hypothetical protein
MSGFRLSGILNNTYDGFTGSRGDTGFTGSIGFTGSQGVIGFTGSRGATGFTGSQGIQGFTGSRGDVGFTGSIGFTGSQGVIGFTGSRGETGFVGSEGSLGFTGSQGALLPWSIKTSSYTMVDGDRIIADTSGGSFNLTLPLNPNLGEYFQITDGFNFSLNPVTILRNGSTIETLSDDVILTIPNTTYEFIYDGVTWQVTATAGPKGDTGPAGDVTTGKAIAMAIVFG